MRTRRRPSPRRQPPAHAGGASGAKSRIMTRWFSNSSSDDSCAPLEAPRKEAAVGSAASRSSTISPQQAQVSRCAVRRSSSPGAPPSFSRRSREARSGQVMATVMARLRQEWDSGGRRPPARKSLCAAGPQCYAKSGAFRAAVSPSTRPARAAVGRARGTWRRARRRGRGRASGRLRGPNAPRRRKPRRPARWRGRNRAA